MVYCWSAICMVVQCLFSYVFYSIVCPSISLFCVPQWLDHTHMSTMTMNLHENKPFHSGEFKYYLEIFRGFQCYFPDYMIQYKWLMFQVLFLCSCSFVWEKMRKIMFPFWMLNPRCVGQTQSRLFLSSRIPWYYCRNISP